MFRVEQLIRHKEAARHARGPGRWSAERDVNPHRSCPSARQPSRSNIRTARWTKMIAPRLRSKEQNSTEGWALACFTHVLNLLLNGRTGSRWLSRYDPRQVCRVILEEGSVFRRDLNGLDELGRVGMPDQPAEEPAGRRIVTTFLVQRYLGTIDGESITRDESRRREPP